MTRRERLRPPSPPAPRGTCRHCGRRPPRYRRGLWRRGLCRRCYDQPAVRRLYPLPPRPEGPCPGCGKRPGDYLRGLCRPCWSDPEVRAKAPDRRGAGRLAGTSRPVPQGPRPLPLWPTEAPPGSEAKVGVLIDRAARRQQLWRPGDAEMDGEDRPADLSVFGSVAARDCEPVEPRGRLHLPRPGVLPMDGGEGRS